MRKKPCSWHGQRAPQNRHANRTRRAVPGPFQPHDLFRPTPAPRAPLRHRLAALALLLGAAGPGIGGEDFIYVVRPGDSPWNITTRYLKSLEHWPRLQRYNRILAPEAIPTGTQLRIPLDWLRSQARPVRIEDLQGRVEVVHRGVPRALERGMAVAEGSTMVRIGTAIFWARPAKSSNGLS